MNDPVGVDYFEGLGRKLEVLCVSNGNFGAEALEL
jgi:hypothetical protein